MKPTVVVQILVHNESAETIDRLLSSLAASDYPRENWKIVVVNNFCEGHDLGAHIESKWLNAPGLPEIILLKQKPNLGFAGGHNQAFEIAKRFNPEFIYLLNADARVDVPFLSRIVGTALANPNAAIIQSRVMLDEEPDLLNSHGNAMHFLGFGFSLGYRERFDSNAPSHTSGIPAFYSSGAGVLVRASTIEKIGGLFDSSYFLYHEDLDLSWRARLAGFDVITAHESVIFHKYEFSKSIKKFFWMERNRHLTNLANYKVATLFLIAPAYLIMEIGTFLFALRSGWAKEKTRALAHLFKPSTWKWIILRRLLISKIRTRSDKEMFSKMAGAILNQEIDNKLLARVINPIFTYYFRALKKIIFW
jgi:GT2 family glycosyltransferase